MPKKCQNDQTGRNGQNSIAIMAGAAKTPTGPQEPELQEKLTCTTRQKSPEWTK